MEIHQLKTFVAVAREGSITRAAGRLHLSQPAVSAHIKAIEEALGVTLFARTPRGMSLTSDGRRILAKAERALGAHRELMEEATRVSGRLTGKLRLGAGSNSNQDGLVHLLTVLWKQYPGVEVTIEHGTSRETVAGIRHGRLDAGYYNETGEPDSDLATIEATRFGIYLAAPAGFAPVSQSPEWEALADWPWIYPASSTCCGQAAERLLKMHSIRPDRIIRSDRESFTRTLIAGGVGVGLLHADTAREAEAAGEVDLLCECVKSVRVLFAYLASRATDPLLGAASAIARTRSTASRSIA
jgi:DNA-binding transcriptional LysR family regulator